MHKISEKNRPAIFYIDYFNVLMADKQQFNNLKKYEFVCDSIVDKLIFECISLPVVLSSSSWNCVYVNPKKIVQ